MIRFEDREVEDVVDREHPTLDDDRGLTPAAKARRAWNDPHVTSLRESHVDPNNDAQVIAWAWTWGHLP